MCGSRKYPYPTTGGISLSTPPPPWNFHIYKELVTHPLPPHPTTPEFPQSKTKPPPTPLEKFILTKKDCQSKEDAICSYPMVFCFFCQPKRGLIPLDSHL